MLQLHNLLFSLQHTSCLAVIAMPAKDQGLALEGIEPGCFWVPIILVMMPRDMGFIDICISTVTDVRAVKSFPLQLDIML